MKKETTAARIARLEAKIVEMQAILTWDAEKIFKLVVERNEARRLTHT